jgi:hypothetical protein
VNSPFVSPTGQPFGPPDPVPLSAADREKLLEQLKRLEVELASAREVGKRRWRRLLRNWNGWTKILKQIERLEKRIETFHLALRRPR